LGLFNILGRGGDWYNLIQVGGLPESPIIIIIILLLIIGIFLTISIFPLLGLKPGNLNALWVLPTGMGLCALVGLGVAYWLVPGSPYALQYHLVKEILISANFRPLIMPAIGLILAGIYVSFYRGIYRKLPATLRTETVLVTWRDLRLPAVLAIVSVMLGLVLIT
jgi:hypothetical protein